jgi:hypothetical protein
MLGGQARAAAPEIETRDFTVTVDNKDAGNYRMTVERQENGTLIMSGTASVEVRYRLFKYKYTYSGKEVWKDGRLVNLSSTCNDNGKQYNVAARADANGLRVRVNDRERITRADVWTTSYWRLPDAKHRNQAVPLLDADTGKEYSGQLKHVGTEQVLVGGQKQSCAHYQVTGGPAVVDLWFDVHERLVLQSFVEQGHRTTIQLAGIAVTGP